MRAGLFALALLLASSALGQQSAPAPLPGAKPPAKAKPASRPSWAELTADQQTILAPLKADWESLEPERRRKWIGIAKRYPGMTAKEQERIQRRMQAWARLTPEQRQQARENYKRIAKTAREKRENLRERWAEYQALPDDERQRLAPPPEPSEKKRR